MSLSDYLLGAGELALIAAALCLGAYHVRAALLPSWTGAPARLAEAVLALTALITTSELLGLIGLFKPGFLVAGNLLVGLGAVAVTRSGAPAPKTASEPGKTPGGADAPGPSPPPSPPISTWMFAVGVLVSGLVIVHWAIPTQQALEVGMYSQDTIWYHMSFAGRMAQESQVGPILIADPLRVVSWFYPQNSELLHGIGISAFGHDILSPLVNIGWAALCLLAGWCIGRPYRVAPLTLAAVAIVLDTPMMVEQAGNAPSDTIALFFLLATVAILVNADAAARAAGEQARPVAETGHRLTPVIATGPLVVAGLAAGLAIGTKITLLAAIGALTVALIWLAGSGNRGRFAAIWGAALAIPSAFWYLRNLVESGNPLPWIQRGPLPGPDQLELYPRKPHKVIDYATDTSVWGDWFFPALDDRLGPLWVPLLIAAVAALVLIVFGGRTTMLRILAGVGLVAMIAYAFTPLSAAGAEGSPSGFGPNLRYFSPGFGIGLALLPLAVPLPTASRRGFVLAGLVAVLVAGTVVQATFDAPVFSQEEIERIANEGQDGFRSFAQESYEAGKVPAGLLFAALLVLVPVALSLRTTGLRRLAIGAGSVAVIAAAVAFARPATDDYVEDRYDTTRANPFEREAGFRASADWKRIQQWGHGLTERRIAVVGRAAAFGQYVFYGPDISNHVQYVADEIPRGGARPLESCLRWRQALNEGEYDFVVITPKFGEPAFSTPPEISWTAGDPTVKPLIQTAPAAVFQITGALDPAGCAPATA